MSRTKAPAAVNTTTLSRVMALLGAIKTKKKAASSSRNLAKARAVLARQRKLDSNG